MAEPETIYDPNTLTIPIRIYIGKVDPDYKEPIPQWSAASAKKWEDEKAGLVKLGEQQLLKENWRGTRNAYHYWEWTARGPCGERLNQYTLIKEIYRR